MITIVGVGHVFNIKAQVRQVILGRHPDVVCVELDRERYEALLDPQSDRNGPVAYRLLSRFQRRIASQHGGRPGDEMLAAVNAAKELGVDVAFIDLQAAAVLQNMWTKMTFEEKVKLMASGAFGMFATKKQVQKELAKFDADRDGYLGKFGDEFPSIKKALIDDRDRAMADAIEKVHRTHPGIVAIIGDGHVDGVSRILEPHAPEIIRLNELLSGNFRGAGEAAAAGKIAGPTNASVTVTYHHVRD